MNRNDLLAARTGVLALIREQSEKRLENQCAFAAAQDARGGAIMNTSAALAAAAVAVAAGSASTRGLGDPLSIGACLAVGGFTTATFLAIWSKRSRAFHSVGWYPNDFHGDLQAGASVDQIQADIILALQERLAENHVALRARGACSNAATWSLLLTPLIALIAAVIAS